MLMQEMQVPFLDWEYAPEKEMTTHSNILAWESHGQRSLGGYGLWGCKRFGHDLATK